jgi:hypothetical protein
MAGLRTRHGAYNIRGWTISRITGMLKTSHDWIGKLAAESDLIAEMQLETVLRNATQPLNPHAFKLANSDAHCNLVTRAIRALVDCSSKKIARNLLCNLIERNTYGAFAELAAYDWLIRCHLRIAPQVALTATDVLGTNGSTLDGKLEHADTYFEVKAFSNWRLAQRLKERLQQEFPNEQVLIEESWDTSFEGFQKLIEEDAPTIVAELKQNQMVRKGRMHIRLEAKKPVTVTSHRIDPYHLAKENAFYPFRDARKFLCRLAPRQRPTSSSCGPTRGRSRCDPRHAAFRDVARDRCETRSGR